MHQLRAAQPHLTTKESLKRDAPAGPRGLPLIGGVKLHRQHIQGVPGGDADSPKQAQQSDHGWLAVAEGQEETADAGDDAGAGWRREKEREETGEEEKNQIIFVL